MLDSAALMAELQSACAGLQFPSEADYPLVPFCWDLTNLSREAICQQAGHDPSIAIAQQDLHQFFSQATQGRTPVAQRYRDLMAILQAHLIGITVYCLGEVEITVYIIGQAHDGTYVGLTTTVVET